MLRLLNSVEVQHLAGLTAIVAVFVASIVAFSWLLSRVIGSRHLGVRHCIWITALVSVSLSPILVGIGQFVDLPIATRLRSTACSFVESLSRDRRFTRQEVPWAATTSETSTMQPHQASASGTRSLETVDTPSSTKTFSDEPQTLAMATTVSVDSATATGKSPPETALVPEYSLVLWALGWTWITGTFIGVTRFLHGWMKLRRYSLSSVLAGDAVPPAMLQDVCQHLGISRPPRILLLTDATAPFTAGVFRPAVYIPRSLVNQSGSLRSVLLHECSHIACWHHWIGLLQRVVRVIAWWHPAVHFLNTQLSDVMEMVCDNCVVQSEDRASYAELLFLLAREFQRGPRNAPLGMVYRPSVLEKRITHILNHPTAVATVSRIGLASVVVAFSVILLLGTVIASPENETDGSRKALTFADDVALNPRTNAKYDAPLLEVLPADAISYVYYQGATSTQPARPEDARWFNQWIAKHWGLDDLSISHRIGMTVMQLLDLADDRRRICLCWERDAGKQRLLTILAGRGDSAEAMLDQIAAHGFHAAPLGKEKYYVCEKAGLDQPLFAAYRRGMYLFSESEVVLQRSLRVMDTDVALKLVDQEKHRAVAEKTQVDPLGAQITWFFDIREQRRFAEKPRTRRGIENAGPDDLWLDPNAWNTVFQDNLLSHIQSVGGTIERPAHGDHKVVHHTMLFGRPSNADVLTRLLHDLPRHGNDAVPSWLPNNVQAYAGFSATPNSLTTIARLLTDETSGERGFFDDMMESIREDPNGPQVDLARDFFRNLGSEIHVARLASDRGEPSVVASVAIADEATIGKLMQTIAENDPSTRKHELPNATVYASHAEENVEVLIGAFCIFDGQLILSTDAAQLMSIVADADQQAGHLVDSTLFQRLSRDVQTLDSHPNLQMFTRSGNSLEPPFFVVPPDPSSMTAWNQLRATFIADGSEGNNGPTAISVSSHADGLTINGVELRSDAREISGIPSDVDHRIFPMTRDVDQIESISAQECVLTAVLNSRKIGPLLRTRKRNNQMILVGFRDEVDTFEARNELSNLIIETSQAYWALYFAYQNQKAARTGRDTALGTWRRAFAEQTLDATREAQCREQYFFFRSRNEEALRDLYKSSERLSYLMGLSTGELLRPSDAASDPNSLSQLPATLVSFDAALTKALESEPSFHRQLVKTSKVLAALPRQDSTDDLAPIQSDKLLALVDKVTAETKQLEAMRAEIRLGLTEAIQDYESTRLITLTHSNRTVAAQNEVAAMTKACQEGSVTLARLLDAQRRNADASIAYHHAAVECILAKLRFDRLTGNLVDSYVVEVQ